VVGGQVKRKNPRREEGRTSGREDEQLVAKDTPGGEERISSPHGRSEFDAKVQKGCKGQKEREEKP